MILKQPTLITLLCSSIFAFAGIIEIVYPAPKLTDYCKQPSCYMDAVDILVGTSEDYFGGLAPWLLGAFLLGMLSIIITFAFRKNTGLLIFEIIFMLDVMVYTIVSRFYHFFSRWPAQSWIVIVTVLIVSGLVITYPFHRQSQQ
ncbi:MAG: hypothetical protein AAB402_04955 [Patescibacteria group bacterium]